jgi:hypothetical protein
MFPNKNGSSNPQEPPGINNFILEETKMGDQDVWL